MNFKSLIILIILGLSFLFLFGFNFNAPMFLQDATLSYLENPTSVQIIKFLVSFFIFFGFIFSLRYIVSPKDNNINNKLPIKVLIPVVFLLLLALFLAV